MVHFHEWIHYENPEHARAEFNMIFAEKFYTWEGNFGTWKGHDLYGVCDDPLSPTWGVFGKEVRNFPHSQLFFRPLFQVRLVYGDVDFPTIEKALDGKFDFILTNEYGLKLPKSVDLLDNLYKVYPLPNRYNISMPSRVDDDAC